jgi:hypothetical protein
MKSKHGSSGGGAAKTAHYARRWKMFIAQDASADVVFWLIA